MNQHVDIEKLKETDAPLRTQVQSIIDGTDALRQVINESVVPLLKAMIARNDNEDAIVGTYYRMVAWMETLVRLRNPIHIQAVCSAARSMFELVLDLKELEADPDATNFYHAFTFVERFRAAKNLLEFHDRTYGVDVNKFKLERSFIGDAAKITQCDADREKYWGRDRNGDLIWPKHWSKKDTAARAAAAGVRYEEWYRSNYPRLSWYIHAGAVGIGGISAEGIEAGFGWANALCQQLIFEASELVASACHLFKGDSDLKSKLETARLVPGKSLIQALLAIEEANAADSEAKP